MSRGQFPHSYALLSAAADRDVWQSGEVITGALVVTNATTEGQLVFDTGSPAVGKLATLAGTPVGNDTRPHRGTGRRIDLAPDASTTIRFVCASSNLDPASGTTLPPDDYLLVVELRVSTDEKRDRLAAPPILIRLQ